ncbi:MAG: hypothetical protein PBV01_09995 [Brucella anthropi]
MKTMSAREAKDRFSLMIDNARKTRADQKYGRGGAVVVSVEE